MSSEIRAQVSGAGGRGRKAAAASLGRTLATMIAGGLAPLAVWSIGTAIVRMTPPVYRSEALVKLAEPNDSRDPLASPGMIETAAQALAAESRPDPMAGQVLRSNVSLTHGAGPGMFKVAATGHDPLNARRTLMAVIESYESHHATAGQRLLVYAAPPESQPVGVPHGMRMALGCAGVASLGLLLSIPLLSRLERVSAIARASAAAGFPRGGGCLPAAQPAG